MVWKRRIHISIISSYIIVLCILISMGCKTNEKVDKNRNSIPGLIKTGEQGLIKQELIFPLESKPTPNCHASTIEEITGGFIAAWFGGTHEKHKDVGIWISINNGKSWSEPVEVVNGVQSDTLRYPCWNPVLFKPDSGVLMLFYKLGPTPQNWWGMLMTSKDEGKTWSPPEKLGKGPHGDLIGPVKNKPVQLDDGTIICPSSRETRIRGAKDIWNVHFEISHDLGRSWETVGPIHDGREIQAIQPSILLHGKGIMQILCRTQQGFIAQSWSMDHGLSWGPMEQTDLPNPNSGTDAVTLEDGRHFLVYNHTHRKGAFPSGRNMLNVAISEDGRSWTLIMTLEKKEGEYSYPAVIQASDGLVHITYTFKRQSIRHLVLDPSELK